MAIAIFKCASHYCFEHTVKKWTTKRGNEVRLIRFRNDLHWVLKTENRKYTSPAINDIYALETYAGGLRREDREILLSQARRVREILRKKNSEFNPVEWLREHVPLKKRISFFEENGLKDEEVEIHKRTGRLTVELTLRGFPSMYGEGVTITRDTWAVTILCRSNKCCSAGHSVIAYEGVIDRKPFVHYAHLVEDRERPGYGFVLSTKNKILDKASNISQSRTWLRPNFKVLAMIDDIESDIEDQKKGKRRYVFSVVGPLAYVVHNMIDTFFGNGATLRVDCHTWATLTLLSADINARQLLDVIVAVPSLSIPLLKG